MYTLFLFGTVRLEGPAGRVTGKAAQRRQLALLALLAEAGEAGRTREKLQALLWPERATDSGRRSLADAVYHLRRTLGPESIQSDGGVLRLDSAAVKTDLTAFQGCLAEEDFQAALQLYEGPFLDGFHLPGSPQFESWRDSRSRRLGQHYETATETLASRAEGEGRWKEAAGFWERLSEHDPLNTRFTTGWMENLATGGDPGNAIAVGEEHIRLLREEVGADAPPELEDLLLELRRFKAVDQHRLDQRGFGGRARALPFEKGPAEFDAKSKPLFVGRESELARLDVALSGSLSGNGSIVLVPGEAGTGKTALASEFIRLAVDRHPDLVVASGYGAAHVGPGDPNSIFREILALLTGDVESGYLGGSISRVQALRLWNLIPLSMKIVDEVGPELIGTLLTRSRLRSRVLQFFEGRSEVLEPFHSLADKGSSASGGTTQQALVLQYVRVLKELAKDHPLLLVLDDLQWADSTSIGLLFHLGRKLEGSRILVLGLFRPTDVALGRGEERHPLEPLVNEFKRNFGDIEIPLGDGGDQQLTDAILDAEPHALDQAFRDTLYGQTGGHPLFTVELLRTMKDSGMLVRDASGAWVAGPDLRWDRIPTRIDAVIGERAARLPPALQAALATASVEGEIFTAEVVARVEGTDPRSLIASLSEEVEKKHRLCGAEGIQRIDGEVLSRYRFRHNLIQRHLYESLDSVEKAHLHQRVADAMVDLYGDRVGTVALELARHYLAAGMVDEAADYALVSGKQALIGFAAAEAQTHLEQSLELLLTLPPSRERDVRELETQLALGNARHVALDPRQGESFDRAGELAESLGDGVRLARALRGSYVVSFYAGNQLETAEVAARCLEAAEAVGDPGLLAHAHECVGRSHMLRGEPKKVEAHYRTALSLFDPGKHVDPLHMGGAELGSSGTGMIALARGTLGFPEQAKAGMATAIALARERRNRSSETYLLWWDVLQEVQFQDAETALGRIAEVKSVSREVGMEAYWQPYCDILEGWCLSSLGKPATGVPMAKRGLETAIQYNMWVGVVYFAALVGQAMAWDGQPDKGLALLDETRDRSLTVGELWKEGLTLQIRGDLLRSLTEPRPGEAEAVLREARNLGRIQDAKWIELRAVLSLAKLLADQGREEEAKSELTGVFEWFTEGFETVALREAAALMDDLDGRT